MSTELSLKLLKDGVCIIDNAVEKNVIIECLNYITDNIINIKSSNLHRNRFNVSRGRFYQAICIDGPLALKEVFLPDPIEEVLVSSLDQDFVFDSFGIISALPGAVEQHWHRDGGILFPGHPLEFMLPASALTVAIPLVEMNAETGSTGFALGSHRTLNHAEQPDFAPIVPIGSAVIWDYRIFHKGLVNRSNGPRPLIYATCCRPWWSDSVNFDRGRGMKLAIRKSIYKGMEPALQARLARASMVN